MSVFDRIGKVVKSEWNHRFGERDDDALEREAQAEVDAAIANPSLTPTARNPTTSSPQARTVPARSSGVPDVAAAMRVLELSGVPTLDAVRAQYRALARHYHPRTTSENADQAHAAHTVLDTLTVALELLEEHLLPLPG
jgi:hypothetical protein